MTCASSKTLSSGATRAGGELLAAPWALQATPLQTGSEGRLALIGKETGCTNPQKKSGVAVVREFRMQISVTGTDTGFESTASESKSLSLGGRLVTVHRPESRRLILQLLNSCNS